MSPGTYGLATFLSISDCIFLCISIALRCAYLYLIHFIISPIDGFLPYMSMPTL